MSEKTSHVSVTEAVSMNMSNMDTSRISIGSTSRQHRSSFSFMANRIKYLVVVDGIDYTPDNIVDPSFVTMEDTFSHAAFETRHKKGDRTALKDAKSRSGVRSDLGMKVYATTINLDNIRIDHTINTAQGYPPAEIDLDEAPSAYYLPKQFPIMSYPPKFFVALKETETLYLFELPSYSYEKGSKEGNLTEEENEYYQYITVGKGRNRKMVTEDTQTKQVVTQTRHTMANRPDKKNASAFASMWDMHDTYAQLAKEEVIEETDEMVMYQCAAAHLLRKKRLRGPKHKKREVNFEEIAQMPEFYDAALLTERVLAAKVYSEAQKKFRGLVSVDPLSLDLVYIYTMKPLWTFECEETTGRPITTICFNSKNPDILAVGHGRFAYAENFTGIIAIWCTKNPCLPERLYRFDTPVTSVAFSDRNPNWLAAGFANGDVCILDVTSYPVKMIAKSKRDTNPCFEPVWVTKWCVPEKNIEHVMTTCQDGRINKFTSTKTHDFICTPMMRISTVEGKMKGLEAAKVCLKVDVPITRYPAALCIHWHPTISHMYLVGTEEGCIHRCSTHYLNQHIDVFKAHSGPVYSMAYSPFMNTLLVSCGADNAIRLWIEGVDDVIMTLNCQSAVYGIAFCPINSTILVAVSGNAVSVWDLRRKTHAPCAEYTFPGNLVLTYIRFSTSGDNVFVGDSIGRVHTFHLEDTPIPPYYQRTMLDEAIKRALCTRPQLLKQLEKLEKFREKYGK